MLKRTPLKSEQKPLKKTPLKKISNKKDVDKDKLQAMELRKKDNDFYMQIWNNRPHKCFETDVPLGGEPNLTMFHHILPKYEYPQYRHEEWNIVLCTWEQHNQFHMNPKKTPKMYAYYLELLEKHNTFEQ